jgi:acyl carrier protein
MQSNIPDGLYKLVSQVLGVEPGSLSEEASPANIPAWDSMNHLNLVMALEGEYGVSLSPEDALAMRDLAAVRRILAQRGAAI